MFRSLTRVGVHSRASPRLAAWMGSGALQFQSRPIVSPFNDNQGKEGSPSKTLEGAMQYSRKLDPPVVSNRVKSGAGGGRSIRPPEKIHKEGEGTVEQVQEISLGVLQADSGVIERAFNRFTGGIGGCSLEEFLVGTQEVYHNVSSLSEYLSELAKDEKYAIPLKEELVGISVSSKQIEERFQKDYGLEKKVVETPNSITEFWQFCRGSMNTESDNKKEGKTSKATNKKNELVQALDSHVSRAVSAITWLVPMSGMLAETIFKTFVLQKKKAANLYAIASPTDHVVESKLAVFVPLDSANVYIADGTREDVKIEFSLEFMKMMERNKAIQTAKLSKEAEETGSEVKVHYFAVKDGKAEATNAQKSPKEEKETLQQTATAAETKVEVESEQETNEEKTTAVKEKEEEERISVSFSINDHKMEAIPADAKAAAIVTLDVIVPPGRYLSSFEWYYKRISHTTSDYERTAIARVVAESIPKWMYAGLDFVKRMFTGKPIEFIFSSGAKRMIGIPENVHVHPPVVRKLMILYMDQSYKWVLSDLLLSEQCYSGLQQKGTPLKKNTK